MTWTRHWTCWRGSSAARDGGAGGPHFTCEEANIIAYVLSASRHEDAAVVWLDEHAASDTEEDTHGGADFDAAHYVTGS